MSYKEVQVQSAVIKEVYGEVFDYLSDKAEESKKKLQDNLALEKEFHKSEEDTYRSLQERVRNITPWSDSFNKAEFERARLMPHRPWHKIVFNMYWENRNPVVDYLAEVESILKGASLSSQVTFTEDQVNRFHFFKSGKVQEECNTWLARTPTFDTQYDEKEIANILKAEKEFYGVPKEKEREVPVRYVQQEPQGDFYQGVGVLILLAVLVCALIFGVF